MMRCSWEHVLDDLLPIYVCKNVSMRVCVHECSTCCKLLSRLSTTNISVLKTGLIFRRSWIGV